MGTVANMKAMTKKPSKTLASATALTLPTGESSFFVSGTTTVASITAGRNPGRIVRLESSTGTFSITDTAQGSAAEGTITTGGGDRALAVGSHILLKQRSDYSWIEESNAVIVN